MSTKTQLPNKATACKIDLPESANIATMDIMLEVTEVAWTQSAPRT